MFLDVHVRGKYPNSYYKFLEENQLKIETLSEDKTVLKEGTVDTVEEDGVELMGYTPWGWIDLISAETGEMKKVMEETK